MASVPARAQSQHRRSSPEQSSASNTSQTPATPVRARSEDSQTIFINHPDEAEQDEEQEQQQYQSQRPPPNPQDDPDVKKCWICFADSTEDTPTTSPWRDPCPCALQAHEECLLDWIADTESPKNSRTNRSLAAPKLLCPQCKAEIHLSRPTDYLVSTVRALDRLAARAVAPLAVLTLSGVVYRSCLAWGMQTIYVLFGPDDGFAILRPLIHNATRAPLQVFIGSPREANKQMLMTLLDRLVHWRLYIGLPLITPLLILARTSLADGIFPVLPILFFATQTHAPGEGIAFGQWPPSASFAFALLPYVRQAYNTAYTRLFAAHEARWLREIQPRAGTQISDNDPAPPRPADAEGEDGENIFEVRIDGGIWEDWGEDEAPLPLGQMQAEEDIAAQPQPPAQPVQDRRLSFSPTALAETLLGALLLPSLAGLAGDALKLLLPKLCMTTPPAVRGSGFFGRTATAGVNARGLLQTKWGRSLVGGCLVVVWKDAVMLYVRWRMAGMQRGRRVLDVDKGKRARSGGGDMKVWEGLRWERMCVIPGFACLGWMG